MEEPPKRKRTFRQESSRKKPKSEDGQPAAFSGFGAKMMAKMGWNKGEGLGKEGVGIQEPIQVRLRNTKGGVGTVSEKSEQQKREEKRKAEQNGEKYVESSEEERLARRKKKGSGTSTPGAAAPRPKKTIYDLEAAGLQVPQTLQSIVDATTGQAKVMSDLSLRGADVPFQTSLAGRVQREVAAFGEAVEAVQADAEGIEMKMTHLLAELESLKAHTDEVDDIGARLGALHGETNWPTVVGELKALQAAYPAESFQKEAVAAIQPLFTVNLSTWDPSSDALEATARSLASLASIIDPTSQTAEYQQPSTEVSRGMQRSLASIYSTNRRSPEPSNRRSTTPYQSMMLPWWTSFHASMLRSLDVAGSTAASFIHAIEIWHPVLPPFLIRRLRAEVKRQVCAALQQWNPRRQLKHNKGSSSSTPYLPQWIFQWLPYTGNDILADLRVKLRSAFHAWPLRKGAIPNLALWKEAFPTEIDSLLIKHMLPRLAAHLRDDFEMDPADQNLEPMTAVLAWTDILPASAMAELLHAEFFAAKFHPCLHSWLTYEGRNFDEIQAWLGWWKDVFPARIAAESLHERDWADAYTLVNAALDLDANDDDAASLPLPTSSTTPTTSYPAASTPAQAQPPPPPAAPPRETTHQEPTFKDALEAWCADANLLLIPLRKADEATGMPLFRITASATGKGGAVVYVKGDVVYARAKTKRAGEREAGRADGAQGGPGEWEPVGLGDGLVARAEGRF